jgi:hypothetical protein
LVVRLRRIRDELALACLNTILARIDEYESLRKYQLELEKMKEQISK